MQVSKREQISQGKPLRCPYCFELFPQDGAAPEQECPDCQAPHHSACWSELGGCAACRLIEESPVEAGEESALGDKSRSPRERRRELTRLLEANERAFDLNTFDYLFTIPSLGLHPMMDSELRFQEHLRENRRSLEECEGLEASELAAFQRSTDEALKASGGRRRTAPWILFCAVILALIGLAIGLSRWFGYDSEEVGGTIAAIAGIGWGGFALSQMVAHWRAWRSHEARQLTLGVLSRDLSEGEAAQAVRGHQAEWKRSSIILGLASIVCLFPPFWFILPLWLVAGYRMPRSLHEKRESAKPELFPEGRR